MENSALNDAEASENCQETDEEKLVYPLWVKDFLKAKFYDECESHPGKNCMVGFCIDCMGEAFCEHSAEDHVDQGHTVLRAFKTSNLISVRVNDIQATELDISKIARCKCNAELIIFIYARRNENTNGRSSDTTRKCRSCYWNIPEKEHRNYHQFCSLSCKIEITGKGFEIPEETDSDRYPINPRKRKRRKGIPVRSPVQESIPNMYAMVPHFDRVVSS